MPARLSCRHARGLLTAAALAAAAPSPLAATVDTPRTGRGAWVDPALPVWPPGDRCPDLPSAPPDPRPAPQTGPQPEPPIGCRVDAPTVAWASEDRRRLRVSTSDPRATWALDAPTPTPDAELVSIRFADAGASAGLTWRSLDGTSARWERVRLDRATRSGGPRRTLALEGGATARPCGPDGVVLVDARGVTLGHAGDDGQVAVHHRWPVAQAQDAACDPRQARVAAVADGSVTWLGVVSGKITGRMTPFELCGRAQAVTFAPDGQSVFVGLLDGTVVQVDPVRRAALARSGPAPALALATIRVSADGSALVQDGGARGRRVLRSWDLALLSEGPDAPVCLWPSPHGEPMRAGWWRRGAMVFGAAASPRGSGTGAWPPQLGSWSQRRPDGVSPPASPTAWPTDTQDAPPPRLPRSRYR